MNSCVLFTGLTIRLPEILHQKVCQVSEINFLLKNFQAVSQSIILNGEVREILNSESNTSAVFEKQGSYAR